MRIHNDLPALSDSLSWRQELTRMRDRILECNTPHVIGIHGDWGSGKTSFMRQLQRLLGAEAPTDGSVSCGSVSSIPDREKKRLEKRVVTIWFDSWRYQNEPVPIVALLGEMRRQLPLSAAIREKFKKIGEIALVSALDVLPDIGKVIGIEGLPSAEKIQERGREWEKDNFYSAATSDSIRVHLLKTIKCLLPEDGSKLVIFIDDLDRCNSKSAIRLLEGLKIYLTLPGCVFVLGMNERVLVDAIGDEISNGGDDCKLRAAYYLEKICTDIYRIPLPDFPNKLLLAWLDDSDQKAALLIAVGDSKCLPPNPRKLKSLANQWPFFAQKLIFPSNIGDRKYWAIRVLIAAYIHQFHRDIWERWHFDPNFWLDIKAWCCGEAREDEEWNSYLVLPSKVNYPTAPDQAPAVSRIYHNPGDINVFWIGSLVFEYRDHLEPADFEALL